MNVMKKILIKQKTVKIIMSVSSALFCLFLAVCIVANTFAVTINSFFDLPSFKVIKDANVSAEERIYYTSDFNNIEDFSAYEKEKCEQVGAEGSVLLKNALVNSKAALPLINNAKISLFSKSSTDIIYGGTGSGSVDTSKAPTLKAALELKGMEVNSLLWDFYTDRTIVNNYSRSVTDINGSSTKGEYKINEVPWSVLTTNAEVVQSFRNYGDAALFVLSRGGGEGGDLWRTGTDGENGDYLRLSIEEKNILTNLNELKNSGTFSKIILIINSSNAPSCDFIDKAEYGIDAALWIGGPGQYGLNGVASILAGETNPSGKLSDTFVYDNLSAPAVQNFGNMEYTNAQAMGLTDRDARYETDVNYVVYQEGVYVGYKYYETRYEDVVLGRTGVGIYDYSSTVKYPFGFGLSYTTFVYSDFKCEESNDGKSFDVSVSVTNTGLVEGKTVVEIYMQKPYTSYDEDYGIEKPSVELVGFAKTKLLDTSGNAASEKVVISVNKEKMRTYDAYGKGTYILEAGNYYLTAASDAHVAVNNILKAKSESDGVALVENSMFGVGEAAYVEKITVADDDYDIYSKSAENGNIISNQLSDIDLKLYEGYEERDTFTYLSRKNWTETWPSKVAITLTQKMKNDIDDVFITKSGYEMPEYNQRNGLSLIMMKGKSYNDEAWDNLLNQMSFEEQVKLICNSFHRTESIISINKPATKETNGPQGITDSFINGTSDGTAFPAEVVMSSTWDVNLMADVGRIFGEQGLASGKNGIYGPAANIHRTAYCGRNYEYFSEDGFLSGAMAAAEVREIEKKGVIVYMKHYALNDQETNRAGICTFANENTIRELYLLPFEMATRDGGVHGYMTVMNRVGTKWGGAHYGLITAIPRGEWGFEGAVITDCTVNSRYTDSLVGLQGGSDFWDGQAAIEKTDDNLRAYSDDAYVCVLMRQAVHRILFIQSNSSAMNGLSANDKIVNIMTWWQIALMVVVIVLGILVMLSVALFIIIHRKNNKNGENKNA